MNNFAFEIRYLSNNFYNTYPHTNFPEILEKDQRPYTCLFIDTNLGFYMCIPFRTDIRHNYAYHFKKSKRSAAHPSGLDFTKMILISDNTFIENTPAIVDQDEFTETLSVLYTPLFS